jgi:hypothetical protein
MQVLLIVIAGFAPVVAVVFGCHALWRWLAEAYAPATASLVLAAVWISVASLAAGAALIISARRRRRKEALAALARTNGASGGDLAAQLTGLPGALGEVAPKALASLELAMVRNPVQTIALLVGAGAVIGRNPAAVVRLARAAASRSS